MSPWARPNRRKAAPMEVTKCLENLFIIFALASLRFDVATMVVYYRKVSYVYATIDTSLV
jgi:hypothetical protein